MPRRTVVDPRFPARLRELRKASGLSLQGLAAQAFVSKSHISELQSGIKTPGLATVQALDSALHADGELVGMVREGGQDGLHAAAADRRRGGAWWGRHSTLELVSQLSREDLPVDRRTAVQEIGMVFGVALVEPLDRWLSSDGDRPRPAAGLQAVGRAEVEQLEQTAVAFRSWSDPYGGGLRRRAVIGQLSEVAELIHGRQAPDIDRRLYRVMAQLAGIAASMSWDSGHGTAAQQYWVLALRAAKQGGDWPFAANILAAMARQLLYMDHISDAAELVRLALAYLPGSETPTVQAMLHTREAWAMARQGRLTAFRRATEQAERALADAQPDAEPYWIQYFDQAEFVGTTGGRLLELAYHDRALAVEAAEAIRRAIQMRSPEYLRGMALDKVGVAEAMLLVGEVEEAVALGHEALDTVQQTVSDRVRVKLVEFRQLTDRFRRTPTVAELRDRMYPMLFRQPT